MPAKWFLCPDGERIKITECLQQCRMADELPAGRCLLRRTLCLIAEQKLWTGVPSTTQLLKGTREAYLEIKTDYSISPQDSLWRVHGSKGHSALAEYNDNALSEERLHDERCSGAFDYYDAEVQLLCDTKFWGSYRIMRALGLKQIEVKTGEVYKTGPNKGKPKTRKEWVDGGNPDLRNEELQLNDYRMKLEAAGFPVKGMFIEAIARDGGCYIARNRGVEQNGILIPVRRLPDEEVKQFFEGKHKLLMEALKTETVPPKCTTVESWEGRKCQKYCNVRETCQALSTQVKEAV